MITSHPEEAMNVYNFHGIQSNSFSDISLKTNNINLMFVSEEKSGDHQEASGHHQGLYSISWQSILRSIVLVEIFNSGQERWTNR